MIYLIRHGQTEFNRDGRYWISRTHVRGKSVLRMMIISYLSTAEHLAGLQQALQAAASRVPLQAASLQRNDVRLMTDADLLLTNYSVSRTSFR